MTDSYYRDPDVEQQLREDVAAEEKVNTLTPSAEGKAGPDYVEGASEEAQKKLDAVPDNSSLPIWHPDFDSGIAGYEKPFSGIEGFHKMTKPIAQGMVDTGLGFMNLVTQGNFGTGDLQDQWHRLNPQGQNVVSDLTRKLSGLVLPSLGVSSKLIGAANSLPWAAKLPGATKFLGEAATRIGVDTVVLGSSTSATDDNIAKTFGDTFGWYAPWATKDADSPDVRFKKNVLYENTGFVIGGEIVGSIFRFRSAINNFVTGANHFDATRATLAPKVAARWDAGNVVIPRTDEAAEILATTTDDIAQQAKHPLLKEIDDKIDALGPPDEWGEATELEVADLVMERARVQVDLDDMDPLSAAAANSRHARSRELKNEALELIAEDPEGTLGHNPIVNDPAQAQQRAVTAAEADPVGAVMDHDKIISDINVVNGRARAALPTDGMRDLMKAPNATARGNFLEQFGARIPKQVDAIYNNKWNRSAEELEASVKQLVQKIYRMNPDETASMLNNMKTNIQEGYKTGFLNDEAFVELSQAFRQVFDEMYDPRRMEASALATQQGGYAVADAAHAAILLDDAGLDTARLMDNALTNMELINQEIRGNRFLWGYQGQMMQFADSKNPIVAMRMRKVAQEFNANLIKAKKEGSNVIQTLKAINEESPQYLNAFKKAYDLTNGDVDELYKLHRWAEHNIGFIRKGFIDLKPEVPSLVMQGIHGIQFNGLLLGLAPARALLGNSIQLIAKPVSQFAGATMRGRFGDLRRAAVAYGGITENFQRATNYAAKEWNYVRTYPEMAMLRGRNDIKFAQSNQFEVMEAMAEGWRAEGKNGKLFMLNWARLMATYNSNQTVKAGINALYTIDGFTNSMMASAFARTDAYDEVMKFTRGKWDENLFMARNEQLYREAFDETGLLTNEAAKHASGEIALNLDNRFARSIDTLTEHMPALKPLFRFARTGVNGVELAWSYNPLSGLDAAIGKARSVFKAQTTDEKMRAMMEHGFKESEFSEAGFQALRNEYRGRQTMGQFVAMSAGVWASQGNLTGNGPASAQERKDMMALGWRPLSIKNPFTGQWHSYRGLEPFDKILATVGDIFYESSRVDSSVAEDWYLKAAWSFSANISNSTFLSGLQPLVSLLGRDETAWKRFIADGHINPTTPFAPAGLRSILSNAITPQIKDVQNEISSFLMNRSKFLYRGNETLKDQIDVYTGDRINYTDPMNAAINSLMPVFKQNGGMEPWRQWLIGTGWDGLHTTRMDPNVPGKKLDPDERWFVNTWIAQNAGLKEQIEDLMEIDQNPEDPRSLTHYETHLKNHGQEKFPVGKTFIHTQLTKIHNRAFKLAWKELQLARKSTRPRNLLENYKNEQIERGDTQEALTTQQQLDELIRLQKPLN